MFADFNSTIDVYNIIVDKALAYGYGSFLYILENINFSMYGDKYCEISNLVKTTINLKYNFISLQGLP